MLLQKVDQPNVFVKWMCLKNKRNSVEEVFGDLPNILAEINGGVYTCPWGTPLQKGKDGQGFFHLLTTRWY